MPTGWRAMNVPGLRCMHPEHDEKAAPLRLKMGALCYQAGPELVFCARCAGARFEAPPPSQITFRPLALSGDKETARVARTRALVAVLAAGRGEPDDDDEDEGEGCPVDKELAKAMDEIEHENDTFEQDAQREARIDRLDAYVIAMIRAGHALGPGSVGLETVVNQAVWVCKMVDTAVESQ